MAAQPCTRSELEAPNVVAGPGELLVRIVREVGHTTRWFQAQVETPFTKVLEGTFVRGKESRWEEMIDGEDEAFETKQDRDDS